jgi:hypothetical protein
MAGPNHFDQFDDQPATTNVAPGNPSKVIKDRNAASASNFDPTIAAAEARIKDAEARVALAKTQAERDKAIADAEKARSEADKARLDANSGSAKAATTVRADAITGYSTAQQLYGIIDDLNKKFTAGPGATSGLSGARDYLPLTANKRFDTAGNAARGIVGQALAFTGGQLNTPGEAKMAIGPFLPQADDRDDVIRDKIARLTDLAKKAEQRSMQILGGRPDPNGNIIPVDAQPANAPAAGHSGRAACACQRRHPHRDRPDAQGRHGPRQSDGRAGAPACGSREVRPRQ